MTPTATQLADQAANWVRDLFLAQASPGLMADGDFVAARRHFHGLFGKAAVDAAVTRLSRDPGHGQPPLLRREDDGSWAMPVMALIHARD